MNEEIETLKIVCQRLEKARIPCMVTGSIALGIHSVPRMTRDIDIVIDVLEGDAERLCALFQDDFYVDPEPVKEAIRSREMFNFIFTKYWIKVDFIVCKDTPFAKSAFVRRSISQFAGAEIPVISVEDLILSKLDWARDSHSEMQLRDVRTLLRTATNIDRSYVERWVNALELHEVYRMVCS